jgi:hypothetical protein
MDLVVFLNWLDKLDSTTTALTLLQKCLRRPAKKGYNDNMWANDLVICAISDMH